jgi:murein hydrolase activator
VNEAPLAGREGRDEMRRKLLTGLILLILVAPGSSSLAQQRDHEAEIERLRGEIRQLKSRLGTVQSRAKSTENDLRAVELELIIASRELEAIRETESRLVGQRAAIASRVFALHASIERHRRYLVDRLAVLYRMGRTPYLRMLMAVERDQDPLEAARLLAYLVGRDARAVSAFQADQERLVLEESRLAEKEQEIAGVRRLADDRRRIAAARQKEKERLLAELRSEERRSAERLAELEEKARRLERLFELLYDQSPVASVAARIGEFKGALDWPVSGKVIEEFGRQRSTAYGTFVVNNGVRIEASPGTPVRAVFQGTVLYAQWFKGYGNLIILDHGERVFSLYGNTRGTTLSTGERVTAGQTIAFVAEGEEGEAGALYFEIRQDNRPADPQGWLR